MLCVCVCVCGVCSVTILPMWYARLTSTDILGLGGVAADWNLQRKKPALNSNLPAALENRLRNGVKKTLRQSAQLGHQHHIV